MKFSVLGCGRWGSFIAWYLVNQGHDVTLWGPEDSDAYNVLIKNGSNEYVQLDPKIDLTCRLDKALQSDYIIISISSQGLRGFMKKITEFDVSSKTFILCMKGIEESTGKRLSEIVCESGISKDKIAVWVGPGHIQEFTRGVPNCMVIDSDNKELTKFLADNLKSELIRFYYGDDLLGSEIGAAAKNVMGIAAGMLDGGGYTSLKGPLMSRGAREVARLIKAMGGNELSAYGLCHLGDYETTLFSEHSHNRRFGEMYVKGESFTRLAEGVMTSKAMRKLGQIYNAELPITNTVYKICFEKADPMTAILELFSRTAKSEFCD